MLNSVNREWINEEKVEYFNILDFISKIKLSDSVLYHTEETAQNFENYLKNLVHFCNKDDYTILYYLLDLTSKELRQSALLEKSTFKNIDLINGGLFFDKLSISHERIKAIHKFVCANSNANTAVVGEYRKTPVDVGADYNFGHQVYWYAPEYTDVKKFMDDLKCTP